MFQTTNQKKTQAKFRSKKKTRKPEVQWPTSSNPQGLKSFSSSNCSTCPGPAGH